MDMGFGQRKRVDVMIQRLIKSWSERTSFWLGLLGAKRTHLAKPSRRARRDKQVRANDGAPGVDGMRVEEFPHFVREHWDSILARMKAGSYQPSPVKRVEIIPPSSGSAGCLRLAPVVCAAIAARQSQT